MGVVKKAIKPMFERKKWNILRGDTVKVLAGKDKGQVGTVTKIIRDVRVPRVIVEGINLNRRHIKRQGENPGGIVSVESPIHYSNVALVDPVTKAAVRVARRYLEDGEKVRISRGKLASQSVIARPEILTQRRKPQPLVGPKDTPVEVVTEDTYQAGGKVNSFSLVRKFSTMREGVPWGSSPKRSPLWNPGLLPSGRGKFRSYGFAAAPLL